MTTSWVERGARNVAFLQNLVVGRELEEIDAHVPWVASKEMAGAVLTHHLFPNWCPGGSFLKLTANSQATFHASAPTSSPFLAQCVSPGAP